MFQILFDRLRQPLPDRVFHRIHQLDRCLFAAAGIAFIVIVSALRIPGIYKPLWEDEIHYHYPILSAPSFKQMRHEIVYQNKAILDFAIRRFLFRTSLIAQNERSFHLISLITAALHLFILLFYPWSESWMPRFVAVLYLASSGLENAFATEAQYYALSSLMGSVPFLALHWALTKSWKGSVSTGAAGLMAALFLSSNANFFNAPLVIAVSGAYGIALFQIRNSGWNWKLLAALWAAGFGILGRYTFWLNKFVLRQMNVAPMMPAQHPTFSIMKNIQVFNQSFAQVNVPGWLFYSSAGASLVNRNRAERWTAGALVFSLLVAKPLFYAYYSYRSDLPLYSRYTIMYLGPAALLVGLGFSSLAGWIKAWIRPMSLRWLVLLALYAYPVCAFRRTLEEWATNFPAAVSLWKCMPVNFSRDFHFFNHVRSLHAPLLILVDHSWCSDIPLMFLKGGIGKLTYDNEVRVLDVGTLTKNLWTNRAREFQEKRQRDAFVVYYFETGASHSGACGTQFKPIFRWPTVAGCIAIFRSIDLPAVPPLGEFPPK